MPYAAFLLAAVVISASIGIHDRVFRRPITAFDARRKSWITESILLVAGAGICARAQARWGWVGVVAFVALTVVVIWFSPHWSWGRRRKNPPAEDVMRRV